MSCNLIPVFSLKTLTLGLLVGVIAGASACSSDSGDDNPAAGGMAAWGGSGGAAGFSGGAAGLPGVGGVATGYWPSPTFTPTVATPGSDYHAGQVGALACMSCHGPTGVAVLKIVFGGSAFLADGVTPAAGVEVGVSDGINKYFVHTAANGMYWAPGTAAVNWPAADIRIRSALGEVAKLPTDARSGDCDSCHMGALVLMAP